MTESRIFQLLLKNNTKTAAVDFPQLQNECVEIAASNLTEIIYETLKFKSQSSTFKRANVLRLINIIVRLEDTHNGDDNYTCFLQSFKHLFKTSNLELDRFLSDVKNEFRDLMVEDLAENVIKFAQRKNRQQRKALERLESVRKFHWENVDSKFVFQPSKKRSFYGVDEKMIRGLLECDKSNESIREELYDFREEEIKVAYAIVNLNDNDSNGCEILQTMLVKLVNYKDLRRFEMNFLLYLFKAEGSMDKFTDFIVENFPFVCEKIILKYSTEITALKNDLEVCDYFLELENKPQLKKIRKKCSENNEFFNQLKNLLFELYCYSFCNKNLLRLCDMLQ